VGKTVAEIASLRETDPVSTYLYLLSKVQSSPANLDDSAAIVIGRSMHSDDVQRILAWPHTNICTDGFLHDRHPRGMGSFTRVLGSFVRENKSLALEAAIHKMTRLAADHMGIRNRGVLRQGTAADMVLFDPGLVNDRATLAEPHMTSVGIEKVWVNGVEVYTGGSTTGQYPGVVIRRGDT
jgi:N-acyl-D-amino-acid deacylase